MYESRTPCGLKIADIAEELEGWFSSMCDGARELVLRLLASLPGGEALEDMGIEPFPIGWKEANLIGRMLCLIEGAWDVDYLVRLLVPQEEDEEENEVEHEEE